MPETLDLTHDTVLPPPLDTLLPRWLTEVPLYRAGAAAVGPDGGVTTAAFRRLPFITKRDIRRDFPRNFLRAGVDLDALLDRDLVELEHTSGTSDERTPLLLARGWWTEQEERALRLNRVVAGVLDEFPSARRVTIVSPVCSGDICYQGRPSRAERIVGRALFVNLSRHPFLWSDAELARMAAEAVEWQPQFLDVDPVYGARFALYCKHAGIRLPSLRFILASYEFVSVVHRRILERVFGVPVFNLYGSTETGHLLMEDDRGDMAPSHATAWLEEHESDARGIGELIVTTLTNDYMPLVRYRIGDLVERHGPPANATYTVHGRVMDAFSTPANSRVTTRELDACFAGMAGVAHYQMVEPTAGQWRLRFVPEGNGPGAAELAGLRERLADRLGAANGLSLEPADALMPESSGKFRLGYPHQPPPNRR